MKKLLILMSLGLMTVGSYSFSIAMSSDEEWKDASSQSEDEWDDNDAGYYDDNSQSYDIEELVDRVEALSFSNHQQKMKSSLKVIKQVGSTKALNDQIIEYGKKSGKGVVLSDDVRLLEEKRSETEEALRKYISTKQNEYNQNVDAAKNNLLHQLQQRKYNPIDKKAFDAKMSQNAKNRENVVCSQEEAQLLSVDHKHSACQKELLTGKIQLKHADTLVKQGSLAQALSSGHAQKEELLHSLKTEVARRRAALMKLSFTRAASCDKTFKFLDWQKELATKHFNGPDGIEAGRIHALQCGDIPALIAHTEYLNRCFNSSYVFDGVAWIELLSTLLLTYIRIIQDAHAVATVDAFIDNHEQEFATKKFPLDARFVAWKQSMNKWFGKSDMDYAQAAHEGVMSYLSKTWAPRMINAMKNNMLPNYKAILAHVKEVIANINLAAMPTPAVVCCLNGNVTWNASQALEEAFRMFDFSENRQEGLEIGLIQLEGCANWKNFLANVFGIVIE